MRQATTAVRARRDFDEPIDLVHLARQTMGDGALEAELLLLYRAQAARVAARLAAGGLDGTALADLAHTIRGASLAIGAGRAAEAAQAVEDYARAGGTGGGLVTLHLEAALREADRVIGALCGESPSTGLAKATSLP